MISLQDKIQKFEKLIYNKDLDDFIPIDEQFISGGITMQSLIKENAFIVEEIKKMKNVFVNYCKLNNTVYQKITEHEIALHSQTTKLQNISSSVQSRLSDAIRQVKEMYEEMKYESVRTKKLVDDAVRPIEEAINRKVDESSFTLHMKRIMAQLDQDHPEGLESSRNQSGQNVNNSLSAEDLQVRKRKGKSVTQDEYEAEKNKNAKLFMELSQKIEELETKNIEFDPIIYKNTSMINKLTLSSDNHEGELFKLARDLKEIRTLINNSEQRLLTQIHNKTSESVWENKFNSFEIKNVIPRFENLSNQIAKNQKQNNRHFADLQPIFHQINFNISSLYNQSNQNNNQIKTMHQTVEEISRKLIEQITIIQQKLDVVYNEKKVKIEKIHQKIDNQVIARVKEIQNLTQTIKELSKTIEDKVILGVKKNIQVKIKQIDTNIFNLNNKQKLLQQEIYLAKGEIHNIKEVLAKKANFTDILMHFQKKADKQDFKELRDRIEVTTPSHLRSTIIENPEKTRRTISASSRKKTNLSRNLINPVSIANEDKLSLETDNDRSSRLFIMGLQNDMAFNSDRRRMSYTESTRRKKKLNSNTGMLNIYCS